MGFAKTQSVEDIFGWATERFARLRLVKVTRLIAKGYNRRTEFDAVVALDAEFLKDVMELSTRVIRFRD